MMSESNANQVGIRIATQADVEWLAHCAVSMAFETERKRLDPDVVISGVRNGMVSEARARYFIAEVGGEPAATLMLTTEWSDWRDGEWWWIQSVYVMPKFRRMGLFRAMYDHVREAARANPGVCGLRLYMEDHNLAAQRTYESVGMQDAAYRVFEDEFGR